MPAPLDIVGLARESASSWFPEVASATWQASVEREVRRPQSTLTVVRLDSGSEARKVLVKAAFPQGGLPLPPRPRLGLDAQEDLDAKHELEWQALCAAHGALGAGDTTGLRAVRPIRHLPDHRTFVLEYLEQTTLRDRLVHASRLDPRHRDLGLEDALRRLGRWVARFHALGTAAEPRRATQDDVAETARRFGTFLAPSDPGLAVLAARVVAAAAALPPGGRLGLGHGDLAPRNAFIDPAGAVTLIDPLGRWRVPVEEDLAAFLLDLRTAGAQTLLGGRAFSRSSLAAYEAAVLDGYAQESGAPIDRGRLAVFTGLVLLDRWAATLTRAASSGRARVVTALVRRRLDAENQRVLAALSA